MLVANRGEIAVRIIKECKKMGIKTVAVCSDIERDALHMQIADEGYCVGTAPIKDSYGSIETIINASIITDSDSIHPGYGLLSENTEFVQLCEQHNILFAGPTSDILLRASDKSTMKKIACEQQIPVLTGYSISNINDALIYAHETGYPVMLKINNGGGGIGMKSVYNDDELKKSFKVLQCGKNRELLIEKYLETVRHIEVQILADKYRNILILGNRDCSIQLDNKKVLEECPAQNLSPELLKKLYADSLKLAQAINYIGIGTVEFLVDEAENYYFMEMNARIQVEYGISEMITGIDLIEWQIKIAAGEKILFSQEDISFKGHAIECRINAQSCGNIVDWHLKDSDARFDHMLVAGMNVTPYYDSLLGKLISYGQTRNEAIFKMRKYLKELQITGIKTNINEQKAIIDNDLFISSVYFTNFLKNEAL